MESYNVLVTAISGDVSNSILKCFYGLEMIRHLYGCDIYEYPCGINKVDDFFRVVPCQETDRYLQQVLQICQEYDVKILVPANEAEILTLSKHRAIFYERGIKLLLHSPATYDIFFNKWQTMQFLKELQLPFIETCFSSEYRNTMSFPLVLKNVFSCGSKNFHIVQDQETMERYNRHSREQIVQRYIGSPTAEYTVPVFSYDGGNHVAFLPLRRTLSRAGYTDFIELADGDSFEPIERICKTIARKIGLYGSIDLQMRKDHGEFFVFECNPRLSGTVNFRRQLGFNDAVWWLQGSMGLKDESTVFIYPTRPFVGIRELNEEIYWKKTGNLIEKK